MSANLSERSDQVTAKRSLVGEEAFKGSINPQKNSKYLEYLSQQRESAEQPEKLLKGSGLSKEKVQSTRQETGGLRGSKPKEEIWRLPSPEENQGRFRAGGEVRQERDAADWEREQRQRRNPNDNYAQRGKESVKQTRLKDSKVRQIGRQAGRQNAGREFVKQMGRQMGRQNAGRETGRQNLCRDIGRQNEGRDLGTQNKGRVIGRQNIGRDMGRQNIGREIGRQNIGRDMGRQNVNRQMQNLGLGRQPRSREKSRQPVQRQPTRGSRQVLQRQSRERIENRSKVSRTDIRPSNYRAADYRNFKIDPQRNAAKRRDGSVGEEWSRRPKTPLGEDKSKPTYMRAHLRSQSRERRQFQRPSADKFAREPISRGYGYERTNLDNSVERLGGGRRYAGGYRGKRQYFNQKGSYMPGQLGQLGRGSNFARYGYQGYRIFSPSKY